MGKTVTNAWVLPIAESVHVAIGEFDMLHIITEWIKLHRVPHTPAYCHRILLWHGRVVPVFDIYNVICSAESARQVQSLPRYFICIVAYHSAAYADKVGYGALVLSALPYRATVTDGSCCDYPAGWDDWPLIAASCFQHPEHGPTPIVDLQKIFNSLLTE